MSDLWLLLNQQQDGTEDELNAWLEDDDVHMERDGWRLYALKPSPNFLTPLALKRRALKNKRLRERGRQTHRHTCTHRHIRAKST